MNQKNQTYRKATWIAMLLMMSLSFDTRAQVELTIDETYNNATLTSIIQQLQQKYSVTIYYKAQWLEGIHYTGTFEKANALYLLDEILKNSPIQYLTIEDNIYLAPREQVVLLMKQIDNKSMLNTANTNYTVIGDTENATKNALVNIQGKIIDGATSEVLPMAKIGVENTRYYATSGFDGDFHLEIPTGIYRLRILNMGYEDKYIDIKAISSGTLNIDLFKETFNIDEVTVTGKQINDNVSNEQMSALEMNSITIKELSSLIGEPDIIKSFATMPGVKTASEFGSGINVRGGSEDQNLFLLENAPLYNTSHVMGLLSVINPDAVKNVTLYKGHIPVEYGQRVSSVMDIRVQDHTIDEFEARGGIGIFSSRLLLQTPLFHKLVKVKIGGRSSYSDYLLTKMPDYNLKNSSASFYDLTGTVSLNFKKNPITFFGYHSNDYFKYANDESFDYTNTLASAKWSHIFGPSLWFDLMTDYSSYDISNTQTNTDNLDYLTKSNISSIAGRAQIKYCGLEGHEFLLGTQATNYSVNPGEKYLIDQSITDEVTSDIEDAYEVSVYIGDKMNLSSRLSVQLGLRYTMYNYIGPKTVYDYAGNSPLTENNITDSTIFSGGESVKKYANFEPRLSVKYMLSTSTSMKASYNQTVQYLSRLSYSSISTPKDSWKLADTYTQPIKSKQLALGLYHNFNFNMYEFSSEVYLKELDNIYELKNGTDYLLSPHIETEMLEAEGDNFGIELLLKKKKGKLTGSASYTYSRAWRQTNSDYRSHMINNNERYASSYDIPHSANLNLKYRFNKRIRLGCSFNYSTGRPVTLPEYTYELENEQLVYFSDRNKYRLPDYHRLDLSLSIDESLKLNKRWKGSWTFSILNIYGRKNAYSVFYQKDTPTAENNYQVFSLYKMYLIGIPMPTVTYNFIF